MTVRRLADGSWESIATREATEDMNLPKMLHQRVVSHPGQVAIERRSNVGAWRPVTMETFLGEADSIARGLIGIGLEPGDHLAILAPTSYEWALIDVAALSCGAITVPIYETDSASQIAHILSDADVRIVITATTQQAELVESVRTEGVRHILSLDRGAERVLTGAAQGVSVEQVRERTDAVKLSDEATVIYTSGTTGMPKGVVLTHGNFISPMLQAYDFLPLLINDPKSRSLLFLPVAHVLARFVMYCLLAGQGVTAFSPDTRNLVNDIATFKPTMLLVVPRVMEKVYNAAAAKAGGGMKGRMFAWAAKQARALSKATAYVDSPLPESAVAGPGPDTTPIPDASAMPSPGPSTALKLRGRVADALVLSKVRAILGPNLHTIISGGAPLALDLANFYRGLGITLLQGYGLSETTGPIAVQHIGKNPVGSVGLPLPGNFITIAKDGEILVRGQSVMPGYYHLPEQTAEVMPDGTWFHTGDLGSIDRKGQLTITGRKKELIVTAGGKNVSPEVLEDALATHPLIANVIVVGDQRPYVGALFTLDADMLPDWLSKHGLPQCSPTEAAELPAVRESLEKAVERANKAVSRAESIRKFRIIDATFTIANGYVTPSMKLRRRKVLTDYAYEVDALYGGPVSAEPTKKHGFFRRAKKN